MKSAEEWVKDSEGTWDADYVRAIQSDAIREAVNTIRYSDIYDGNLNQLEPALRLAKSIEMRSNERH